MKEGSRQVYREYLVTPAVLLVLFFSLSGILKNRVFAYVLLTKKWPGNFPEVLFLIKDPGFNDGTAGSLEQQDRAIREGASVWENEGGARFRFNSAGTTSTGKAANDRLNIVIVRNAAHKYHPAEARIYSNKQNDILDCDIVFYDRNYVFSAPVASRDAYDIQSVAAQEFGHCAGLNHSPVQESTMYRTIMKGNDSMRTLHQDDIDGVQSIYSVR